MTATDAQITNSSPTTSRRKVHFDSGGDRVVAWHYPGTNGACVVMAGGAGVTKEPAADRFGARFNDAGFSILAFDFRHFGESGGQPRQVVSLREQLADCEAAFDFARTLPEVDPARVALWGFSLAGGHMIRTAAQHPEVAAVIAQAPLADGRAAAPNGLRSMTPGALVRLTGRALLDATIGALLHRPLMVPLSGERGTVASITTPDSTDAGPALNPDNRYPDWRQEIAARSILALGSYRPGRDASRVHCPLLVVAYDGDLTALAPPAVEAGQRAPRGEVVQLPGRHYAAFLEAHERTVEAELDFLRRHLLL